MKFTRTLRRVGAAAVGTGLALAVATPAFAADEVGKYPFEVGGYEFTVTGKATSGNAIKWSFSTEEEVDGKLHKIGNPVELPNSKSGENVNFKYSFMPSSEQQLFEVIEGAIEFKPNDDQDQVTLTIPDQSPCYLNKNSKKATLTREKNTIDFFCSEWEEMIVKVGEDEDAAPLRDLPTEVVETGYASTAILKVYAKRPKDNNEALATGKPIGKDFHIFDFDPAQGRPQGDTESVFEYEKVLKAEKGKRVTEPFTVCLVSIPDEDVSLEDPKGPLCQTYNPTVITEADQQDKQDKQEDTKAEPVKAEQSPAEAKPASNSAAKENHTLAQTGSSVAILSVSAALLLVAGAAMLGLKRIRARA